MRCFLFFSSIFALFAERIDVYNSDERNEFYDTFVCEEKNQTGDVSLTNRCTAKGSDVGPPGPPPGPPGPPPPPPKNPLPPAPVNGYLPIVVSNQTNQPDEDVYITLIGNPSGSAANSYFSLQKNGRLIPVSASNTTFSAYYSYKLTELPKATTGSNEYLVYVPPVVGARFYFSIGSPIYLQSETNSISAPTYYAFYDPNYNTLFETAELTFLTGQKSGTCSDPTSGGPSINWTATLNTTEVDAFGFPIEIGLYSYDPNNQSKVTLFEQDPNAPKSGFNVSRKTVLDYLELNLASEDKTGQTPKIWPKLMIPFYDDPYSPSGQVTYLRVLSPKQSLGNAASPNNVGNLTNQHLPAVNGANATTFQNYNYPPFPIDYLTVDTYTNGAGVSYFEDLFSFYTSGQKLYIQAAGGEGGQTGYLYEGAATGTNPNQVLTFTYVSQTPPPIPSTTPGPYLLNQTDANTYNFFSGSQLLSPSSGDGGIIGLFLGDCFTIGFVPSSTKGGSIATALNPSVVSWQNATDPVTMNRNMADYYSPQYSLSGGPWYDLYAKLLHDQAIKVPSTVLPARLNFGLCYGYDFDDTLDISGACTPSANTCKTSNPYYRIILHDLGTALPTPNSDTKTYDVTFTFTPAGSMQPPKTLEYMQGTGDWISVSSGTTVPNLQSNSTTPLKVRYSNNDTNLHEFIVNLKYQFLVPVGSFNASETAIINSTTITPNAGVTAFTINMSP